MGRWIGFWITIVGACASPAPIEPLSAPQATAATPAPSSPPPLGSASAADASHAEPFVAPSLGEVMSALLGVERALDGECTSHFLGDPVKSIADAVLLVEARKASDPTLECVAAARACSLTIYERDGNEEFGVSFRFDVENGAVVAESVTCRFAGPEGR